MAVIGINRKRNIPMGVRRPLLTDRRIPLIRAVMNNPPIAKIRMSCANITGNPGVSRKPGDKTSRITDSMTVRRRFKPAYRSQIVREPVAMMDRSVTLLSDTIAVPPRTVIEPSTRINDTVAKIGKIFDSTLDRSVLTNNSSLVPKISLGWRRYRILQSR